MVVDAIRRVGVIGLGRMGRPIARRLLQAGFSVRGYDRDPEAMAASAGDGTTIAESAAQAAVASDLIIIAVGFERQVEDVVFGKDGLAGGLRPGAVVAIVATVSPTYTVDLAERLTAIGARVIDAPLVRGEAAAEAGRLVVYAGGAEEDIALCGPVFDALAEHVFRLGGSGSGQVAKAVNNMLLWTCICANVEGLEFAQAHDVDGETLRAALACGSGANWALTTGADRRPMLWAEKDMEIVLEGADRANVAMPVAQAVERAIKALKVARGLPAPSDEG